MSRLSAWFADRAPVNWGQLGHLTNEPVPGHLRRWWFALGGTAAFLFAVQILTGILLLFYYVPEPGRAYDSVRRISTEIPLGWWIRSLHKWAASGMIIAVCLHTLRVFFTGSYRRPRELTWVIGCFLLFATLAAGLSGYSLVYEQLSYWGATVTANLAGALPAVGPALARLIRGGDELGPATLTRFFVVHAAILPVVIAGLVALHVVFIRLHGVSELRFADDPPQPPTYPLIPDHVLTELSILLVLMTLLNVLAVLHPAGLGEPANPQVTPAHIRPEWYFYFAFRWLKLTSLRIGVLGTALAALIMIFWPAVDAGLRRLAPRRDLSAGFGVAAVLVVVVLTVWEALT